MGKRIESVETGLSRPEAEPAVDRKVVRGLAYRLLSPSELKQAGERDGVRWLVAIKSDKSTSAAGRADLVGGGIEDGENWLSALRRELREELSMNFLLSGVKQIGEKIIYQIPGQKNNRRQAQFALVPVFGLEEPMSVNSEESKIDKVLELTTTEMLELIGKGEIVKDGEEIKAIDYLALGVGNNPAYEGQRERQTQLWPKIEEVIKKTETEARQWMNYYANAGEEGKRWGGNQRILLETCRFTQQYENNKFQLAAAVMYGVYGWGKELSLESVEKFAAVKAIVGELTEQEEIDGLANFLKILEEEWLGRSYNRTEGLQVYRDKKTEFGSKLERRLRQAGIMTGSLSLKSIFEEASRFFDQFSQGLEARGVKRKEELGLHADVRNSDFYRMMEIMLQGRLYDGKKSSQLAQFQAAMMLAVGYVMMRNCGKYEAKVAVGDVRADSFFRENFWEREDLEVVEVGGEECRVREYKFSEAVEVGGKKVSKLLLVVKEGQVKSLGAVIRKLLLGERMEEINDIFRRSVVILGYVNKVEQVVYFELDETGQVKSEIGQEIMEQEKEATLTLVRDLQNKFTKSDLSFGNKERKAGEIKNNLQGNKSKGRVGTVQERFRWVKGYLFDGVEISELAVWASLWGNEQNWGYNRKVEDDKVGYVFWRLQQLLGWFVPAKIYGREIAKKPLIKNNLPS